MMIPPRRDYQCYYRKVDCTRSYHLQLLLDIMIDIRPIGDAIVEKRRRRIGDGDDLNLGGLKDKSLTPSLPPSEGSDTTIHHATIL
jgi:hypothetical protein